MVNYTASYFGLQHKPSTGAKTEKNEYKYTMNVSLFLFYKNIS